MNNSQYAPTTGTQYSSKDLNADFQGFKFTATAGVTTTGDYKILNDSLIDGAVVLVKNSALGDKVTLQVIDIDNIIGYGANVVLGQYVTNWYINPDSTFQVDLKSAYPAKILAGLYLRVSYTSVGANNVDFLINYKLHKILW